MRVVWGLLGGTNFTSATPSTSWYDYTGATQYLAGHAQNGVATTASATWYLTGVQFELGSSANDYAHKSYGDELHQCRRYFQRLNTPSDSERELALGIWEDSSVVNTTFWFHPVMRATPTASVGSGTNYFTIRTAASNDYFDTFSLFSARKTQGMFRATSGVSGTGGQAGLLRTQYASATVDVSAEL